MTSLQRKSGSEIVPRWRAHYPFESRWVTLSQGQMHYVDEPAAGHSPSRSVLLLIHGNPTWSFHWRELISAWQDRYRVVAPDHLGCGLSQKVRGKHFCLADRIEHLREFIAALDLKDVTLVAQDWGGAIGLGAALDDRDRFQRLILMNTGAFRPWFIPWRLRLARHSWLGRVAIQGGNLFCRAALRMTTAQRLPLPVREGYLAPYRSWGDRQAVFDFVRDIPTSPRHPTYSTLDRIESRLSELARLPVLLIWGMQDWCFTPECLEKFLEIFPRAEAHRLPDAGHWVVEDAPDRVARLVDSFLERHAASTCSQTHNSD